MRAFDYKKEEYSDFVLSRIEKLEISRHNQTDLPIDQAWETKVNIQLTTDPSLSVRQKESLEIEYDMVDGLCTVNVRKAMLFYYLRHYGFNPLPDATGRMKNESSFRLFIANFDGIERQLERRG